MDYNVNFKLTQVNGNVLSLSDNKLMVDHAYDTRNYFSTIIDQINGGLYQKYMPPVDKAVIIDAGANVGLFSLYCAVKEWRVYAIEPTIKYADILISFLKDNPQLNQIRIFNRALWNEDGEVSFEYCDHNYTMNHVGSGTPGYNNAGKVKSCKLDSFILENVIGYVDLVKMDTEGAEPTIIDAISNESFNKIQAFWVEFHDMNIIDSYRVKFEEHGYRAEKIGNDTIYATK